MIAFTPAAGQARKRPRYDLPLQKTGDTRFLFLLIALMTYLAGLAVTSGFALQDLTDRWRAGLAGQATVEIPSRGADGQLLAPADIHSRATQIAALAGQQTGIAKAAILPPEAIRSLVAPWLSPDAVLPGNFPLPALVAVETAPNAAPDTLSRLEKAIKAALPTARLETHESWLDALTRFTRAFQYAAFLLTLVVGVTAVTALAGAIRAKMAIHRREVEILHLMGAADRYIARQFERHAFILALQSGLVGLVACGATIFLIGLLAGKADLTLLPDFHLTGGQKGALCLLPCVGAVIAGLTASHTVRGLLKKMP